MLGTQGYNLSVMKVLNSQQMQQCDREAINDYGISESVLMENAGVQVVESMDEYFGDGVPELIAVMCGKGNNGGDGFVVARHLYAAGSSVRAAVSSVGKKPGAMALQVIPPPDHSRAIARVSWTTPPFVAP